MNESMKTFEVDQENEARLNSVIYSLVSDDEAVRRDAVISLTLGPPYTSVLEALARAATGSEDVHVRRISLKYFLKHKSHATVDMFLVASGDNDTRISILGVEGLASFCDDDNVFNTLVSIAQSGSATPGAVRAQAISSLAASKKPEVVQIFVWGAFQCQSRLVRKAAYDVFLNYDGAQLMMAINQQFIQTGRTATTERSDNRVN